MGNESGYGKHFETLYDYTKKIDPPVPTYEGGGYNSKERHLLPHVRTHLEVAPTREPA